MGREAGHTQGFGRVSPVTRPSPYSPVQFRGRMPASEDLAPAPAGAALPRRRRGVGRALVIAALIAAVAAGLVYFTAGVPPTPPAGTLSLPGPAPAATAGAAVAPRAPGTAPTAPRSKGS